MVFSCNFHDIYYVYNFESHYWIIHIQFQFTIIASEILLNTTQNKKKRLVQ